ncbi:hypothetical protein TorRG33x02_333530, partial [Trema orientale]
MAAGPPGDRINKQIISLSFDHDLLKKQFLELQNQSEQILQYLKMMAPRTPSLRISCRLIMPGSIRRQKSMSHVIPRLAKSRGG